MHHWLAVTSTLSNNDHLQVNKNVKVHKQISRKI